MASNAKADNRTKQAKQKEKSEIKARQNRFTTREMLKQLRQEGADLVVFEITQEGLGQRCVLRI